MIASHSYKQTINTLLILNSSPQCENHHNSKNQLLLPLTSQDEMSKQSQEEKYSTSCLSKSKDYSSNSYYQRTNSHKVRLDTQGQPILRGLSQHHISFADKIKHKTHLVEVIQVESFKPYNSFSKLDYSAAQNGRSFCIDVKSNCCVIY